MSSKSLAKIPKIASSLLIFSPINLSPPNKPDYELLFLKRKGNMSFSNVFAFPGGVLEQSDEKLYSYIPNNHKPSLSLIEEKKFIINRITALRETFEESALFFVDAKIHSDKKKIFQIIENLKQNKVLIFEKLVENFSLPLNWLIPLLRIITIQPSPKRYDTYFFGVFLNNSDIFALNIGDYNSKGTESSLFSHKILQINLEESDTYRWMTPNQCIEGYYEGKFDLAPPQIFQMTHYLNFPRFDSVQKFYRETFKGDVNSQNELIKRPQYFPSIMEIKKLKNELYWVCPGDFEYDFKKIANNEEDKMLGKEIFEKNSTIIIDKKQMNRFLAITNEKKKFVVKSAWISNQIPSPFEGVKTFKGMIEKPKL